MAIYYTIILALTGLGFLCTGRNQKKRASGAYLAVAFLILVGFASFRYAIGFDYFAYQMIYDMVNGWRFADIFHYYWGEPLFFVVCKFFCLAGCTYPVFLAGINLFLFFAAMRFIYRYSKIPWLSVYLYITLQFLAYDMNLLRQSIAISFFLFAYPYLMERKPVHYTILILVGGLFHNSLFFVYPLYFLLPLKLTKKAVAGLFALTIAGYVLFDPLFSLLQPFLPLKYANYEGTYFWNSSTLAYVAPAACYCLLLYLFRRRILTPMARTVYLNSALYHFLISLFITKHFILERFAVYPFIFALVAIPDIVNASLADPGQAAVGQKGRCRPYVALFVFLVFGGAYFLFAAAKGFHNVYPYVSLLDKSYSSPNG